jgi:Mce-associated membrane protein
MSPKAKVDRNGESGDTPETIKPATAPATTAPAVTEPAATGTPATESAPDVRSDPSPFDSQEFLEANRRNRDKMRAAAEAKRAKEAAREERRAGRGRGAGAASDAQDTDRAVRRGGRWAVPVLSILLIAALVAAGVFAYLYREADSQSSDADRINELRPSAVDAAGQYAADLLTYDSANFAELDSRITDISTPTFAKDFIEGSRQAREGSANAQAVASAKVKEAALQSISSTNAVVLVAMDQLVKSPQTDAELPEGIPYQSMVKVTLERVDGTWLISDFKVV